MAVKEHAEFVNSLELIETLAPGLYEMVIEEVRLEEGGKAGEHLEFNVRFEARSLDDIRALDDGREDERPFQTVARFSEVNDGLYEAFMAPWIRAFANERVAKAARFMQPSRLDYIRYSDWNPWMRGVALAADMGREHRQALPADDPFRAAETALVDRAIVQVGPGRMPEHGAWRPSSGDLEPAILRALDGEASPQSDVNKPAASRGRAFRELAALSSRRSRAARARALRRGGAAHRLCREPAPRGWSKHRGYRAAVEVRRTHPRLSALDPAALRAEAKEAAADGGARRGGGARQPAEAPADGGGSRDALDIVRRIAGWRPEILPEVEALLARVEAILEERR